MQPELIRRQRATQATMDKYRHQPFNWRKSATCIHMARFHLKQMGHKPPPLPPVRNLLSAKRALAARGWANVSDMLDSLLERIPPAAMTQGDIAVLESEDGLGAITLSVGAHVMGWHEDVAGFAILDPLKIEGAWRC